METLKDVLLGCNALYTK